MIAVIILVTLILLAISAMIGGRIYHKKRWPNLEYDITDDMFAVLFTPFMIIVLPVYFLSFIAEKIYRRMEK